MLYAAGSFRKPICLGGISPTRQIFCHGNVPQSLLTSNATFLLQCECRVPNKASSSSKLRHFGSLICGWVQSEPKGHKPLNWLSRRRFSMGRVRDCAAPSAA